MASAFAPPRIYFTPEELNAACAAAADDGDETFTRVFTIAPVPRVGRTGAAKYFDLCARVPGKTGRLQLRFRKERNGCPILPLLEADAILAAGGGGTAPPQKRDPSRAPSVGIRKYMVKLEVSEEGELVGELPGPDAVSPYFQLIENLDKFFVAEIEARLASNRLVAASSRGARPAEAVLVQNIKVVNLYQDFISLSAVKNPGKRLYNPIARIPIKFDAETGRPIKETEFYDWSRPYHDPTGGLCFEELRFGGRPVCAETVHNIRSGSLLSGIVDLGAVCASNMGLSIPLTLKKLVVEPPPERSRPTADLIFDEDDLAELDARAQERRAAAASAPAARRPPEVASSEGGPSTGADAGLLAPALSEDALEEIASSLAPTSTEG